jgi:predicted acyl esterase
MNRRQTLALGVSTAGLALLGACGGDSSAPSQADPDILALDRFARAAAGHRVAEFMVAMPDGQRLQTWIYLPRAGSGPFPTLVSRTPYDLPYNPIGGFPEDHANEAIEARPEDVGWTEATDRGYALVINMPRGRGNSEGRFQLLMDSPADADKLLQWVEKQPWCNGRIGVMGDSAAGALSLQMAASRRPSVKAVYAQATTPDFFGGSIFEQGLVKWEAVLPFMLNTATDNSASHEQSLGLGSAELLALKDQAGAALGEMFGSLEAGDATASGWWTEPPTPTLPVVSRLQPAWTDFLALASRPSALAALDASSRIEAPTLHVTLWHDVFHTSAMRAWQDMQARRGDQRLIVLDGTHYEVDGPDRWAGLQPLFTWFDHHLKAAGSEVPAWPRVRYIAAGDSTQTFREAPAWPLPGSMRSVALPAPETTLQLQGLGAPTLGGNHLAAAAGMVDQTPLLGRPDVVSCVGEPMDQSLLLGGAARVRLPVLAESVLAGSAWLALRLVDVLPSGEWRLVREKMQRVSAAGMLTAEFDGIAYRFEAGSRPALVVTAGNFPAYVPLHQTATGTLRFGPVELLLPAAAL